MVSIDVTQPTITNHIERVYQMYKLYIQSGCKAVLGFWLTGCAYYTFTIWDAPRLEAYANTGDSKSSAKGRNQREGYNVAQRDVILMTLLNC